jgi:integrase
MARKKKQRGNGQGTVAPRRNSEGKIIGYRGAFFGPDGKRHWVSAKTKTECWTKLNAAMTDADRGVLPSPATLTIERYLNSLAPAMTPTSETFTTTLSPLSATGNLET